MRDLAVVNADPMNMLWHYARGEMPCYVRKDSNDVGWLRYTHRGVQFLDRIDIPKGQRRYVFHPKFEIRYDTAFEECLSGCADLKREGRTWITKTVFEGYMNLHRLGFAHSYEAWCDGQLAGGGIGIQIGAFITCESLFHRVSNASKAAWGQLIARLKERGFSWIDTNCVAAHQVNFGEEWVPQWKFEQMIQQAMGQQRSIDDHIVCRTLPWSVKARLLASRLWEKGARKLGLRAEQEMAPAPV